jgi:hypothetical protein
LFAIAATMTSAKDKQSRAASPAGDLVRWAAARWLRLIGDATEAWVKPGLAGAHELAAANERLATSISDGLLDLVQGQSIDWKIGDRTLRAVVGATRLRRVGMEVRARVELRDVVWGDWPFEAVSATAASLGSDPSSRGKLTAFDVELVGRTKLEPLLAWLGHRLGARTLDVDRDGRINVVRRRIGPRVIIGAADVSRGRLEVELHGVGWGGVRLKLPARLRKTRFVELPPLPLGASIVEACRDGDSVHVRVTVPVLSWSPGQGRSHPDWRLSS